MKQLDLELQGFHGCYAFNFGILHSDIGFLPILRIKTKKSETNLRPLRKKVHFQKVLPVPTSITLWPCACVCHGSTTHSLPFHVCPTARDNVTITISVSPYSRHHQLHHRHVSISKTNSNKQFCSTLYR